MSDFRKSRGTRSLVFAIAQEILAHQPLTGVKDESPEDLAALSTTGAAVPEEEKQMARAALRRAWVFVRTASDQGWLSDGCCREMQEAAVAEAAQAEGGGPHVPSL